MPYTFHLYMVDDEIMRFQHLIPPSKLDVVRAGGACHDVIEDARQTYNDVKQATNEEVAELAYALTNEKGKNRKERANHKYYDGILDTDYACFLKLCDRIANITHSKKKKSSMLDAYRKENTYFCLCLHRQQGLRLYEEMFVYIDKLLLD